MKEKRFLAALICLCMALALLPGAAFATAPVTIAGLPMTATATQSSYYINGANGAVGTVSATEPAGGAWNAKLELTDGAYMLKLKNLNVQGVPDVGRITSNVSLTINLWNSHNQVTLPSAQTEAAAIDVTGDLTISSSDPTGSLEAESHGGNGINVTGDLTVARSVTSSVWGRTDKAGCCGIYVGGDLLAEAGTGNFRGHFITASNADTRGIKVLGNAVINSETFYAAAGDGVGLEAGGSITLSGSGDAPMIDVSGGTQAMNKAPDLSGRAAYVWTTDPSRRNFQPMPYTYDAGHTFFSVRNIPSITITDVTVSGAKNSEITPVRATIDLNNADISGYLSDNDVTSWFTNIPAGVSATIVNSQSLDKVVEFSGRPTAVSTAAMAVTIPGSLLRCGLDVTVTANANAKWNITESALAAPVLTLARSVASNVGLTWTTVPGATGYRVYRGTSAASLTACANAVSPWYSDTGAAAGNSWYYQVCAVQGTTEGPRSNTVTAALPAPVLTAPALTLARSIAGNVGLTWTRIAGVTGYSVYRGVGSAAPAWYASSTNPWYIDAKAAPGARYTYQVFAYCTGTTTAYGPRSNAVTATVPAFAAPALSVAYAQPNRTGLTWTAVPGAQAYSIYRGTAANALTWYASGASRPGTTYYYKVFGSATIGGTRYYTPHSAVKAAAVPALSAPTINVVRPTAGNVGMTWNGINGATGYSIYRGTTPGSLTWYASSTNPWYSDRNTVAGTTYYYQVLTYLQTGEGNWYSPKSATASAAVR